MSTIQSRSPEQIMRDDMLAAASAQDKARRLEVLKEHEAIQQSRADERAAVMDALVGTNLATRVNEDYTATLSVRVTKDGSGRATLYLSGVAVPEGDLLETIFKAVRAGAAAVPAEDEKVAQGFRSRTPRPSA